MLRAFSEKPLFWLVLLLPLLCIPLFGHLGEMPLDSWDEARLATHAHEMHHSGNWLVTTYDHLPEMWNTKPPLMIWLQVLCIRIFGESEFAIRFPSALAALGTCLVLFWFFAKEYRRPVLGAMTCLVLITCEGYVRRHGTRSGDYDSLLTLFTTSFLLLWFLYLEKRRTIHFYLFICVLILACLTKGVQPLIFMPGVLMYTIYCRRIGHILRSSYFYIGVLLFSIFVLGFYLLREYHTPGYIAAVFKWEVGGRFNQTIEGHHGGFTFYIGVLERYDLYFWFVLVPLGLIIALGVTRDKFIKQIAIWAGTTATIYLLIISLAATKISWYNIPAIPLLSVLAAISLYTIFQSIQFTSPKQTAVIFIIAAAIFLLLPYRKVFEIGVGIRQYTDGWENRKAAEYFQRVLRGAEDIEGYYFAYEVPDQNHRWYLDLLKEKKGIRTSSVENLNPGSKVIIFQSASEKYLEANYEYDVLSEFYNVKKYYIKARKAAEGS